MSATLQLDIVSPERSLYGAQVTMVEVPGVEGDFGVLPGHMPLISTIRPGVVTVHGDGTPMMRFFVGGGYAEVTNESCTLLSAQVHDMAGLDKAKVEEELAHARRVLEHAEDEAAKAKAQQAVTIAEALFESLMLLPVYSKAA
jgi:F-type H+-transporting ATPase subunit epsilon